MVDAAGLLAAHGSATLARAYFKDPGLPAPGEHPPGVLRARFGCCAANRASTSHVVSRWAVLLRGEGGGGGLAAGGRDLPLTPAPIALEHIKGPILAVGAGLDNVGDSPTYVHEIQQRRTDPAPVSMTPG